MSGPWDFPADVTEATGLTSWPDRGSDLASAFAMEWRHAKRCVTITYESQDALWCVTEFDGPRTVSTDLYPRAEAAYSAALDIIVSPLP